MNVTLLEPDYLAPAQQCLESRLWTTLQSLPAHPYSTGPHPLQARGACCGRFPLTTSASPGAACHKVFQGCKGLSAMWTSLRADVSFILLARRALRTHVMSWA